MATPKTVTDNSSDLDEAVLNLFIRGGKLQVKVNYVVALFTAATNVATVDTSYDSDGEIIDADLTWNAGSTRLDITLSGFSTLPVVQAIIVGNSSTNVDRLYVDATAATNALVKFIGAGPGGSSVDPDGDMTIAVLVIGA